MSYVRKMIKRDELKGFIRNARITIGCRCAFKAGGHWTEEGGFNYEPGRQCIIAERVGKDFSVLVLPEGFTGSLTKDISLYNNKVAWVNEDELELVDRDYSSNLDFLDWFGEVEENICGDCRKVFLNEDGECPDSECPSNNLEDYEDSYDGFGWN